MECTIELVHIAVPYGYKLSLNFYRYISHACSDGWMRNKRATQQWKSIVLNVGWSTSSPSLTWVSILISVGSVDWLKSIVISSTFIFMLVQNLHMKKSHIGSVLSFSKTGLESIVLYSARNSYMSLDYSVGIYILIPMTGQLMLFLDRVDAFIYKVCPFVAAGVVVGSIYWTAVTYGAITVMQVIYYC